VAVTVRRDRLARRSATALPAPRVTQWTWLPQAAGLAGTLEELRGYARGVLPAVLADGGLAPTLKALAQRAPSTKLYILFLAVFAFPSLFTLEAPHDDPSLRAGQH
jgi:hypothetical protein